MFLVNPIGEREVTREAVDSEELDVEVWASDFSVAADVKVYVLRVADYQVGMIR